MTTIPIYHKKNWFRRTVRYSCLAWAALFLSWVTALAQTDFEVCADMPIGEKPLVPASAPRKALVIVAGKYTAAPKLPSAKMDFCSVSEKLRYLGFEVTASYDEPYKKVWDAIKRFQGTLKEGDLAVVYFSGHGFQFGGLNYFAPANTEQLRYDDLTTKVVPLSRVIDKLSQKKIGLGLIILDACRVNKIDVQDGQGDPKRVETGLQKQSSGSQMVIAYAADFGHIALASTDCNKCSLYTNYLVENMDPDDRRKEILEILKKVDGEVIEYCEKNNCDQTPRFDDSVASFHPNPSEDRLKLEKQLLEVAFKAKDESAISTFKREWPVSVHAASARQWLADHNRIVPPSRIFHFGTKFPHGYRVIRGEALAAPEVIIPADTQRAIVASDYLILFKDTTPTPKQIATLQRGDTVSIDLKDLENKVRNPEESTPIWSKVTVKVGSNRRSIEGYVKDAVRIDDYVPYAKYIIKLKPTNEADVLGRGAILVSSLDEKDLPEPISLTEALASNSSSPLSKTVLSQSDILVELHNCIEGCLEIERARTLSFLKAVQIRDALIGSGAKTENIYVRLPNKLFPGDKGQPGRDEITILMMERGSPAPAKYTQRETSSPLPVMEDQGKRRAIPFRDAVERYYGLPRTGDIGKIFRGEPGYWKDHKWQAALLYSDNPASDQALFCGGTLVRNNWVVTAAHCVYDDKFGIREPSEQEVLTGTDNLSSSIGKRSKVEAIYVHENFHRKKYNSKQIPVNDIALLKLKDDGIGDPIKLVTKEEEPRIVVSNKNAMIAGWGVTEYLLPSPELKQAPVPLVSHEKCNGPGSYDGAIEENMICAGSDNGGPDACRGDSGGPAIKDGFLIGIVSWAGDTDECGIHQYGVYTRVSQFAEWIEACIHDPGACKSLK